LVRYGIVDGLQSGAVDIYFAPVMSDFAPKGLVKVPVSTSSQYVILPRHHRLADRIMVSIRELDGEQLAPAKVRQGRSGDGVTQLSVIIHQGKNRQVRRMCAKAGLTVLRLKRIREGKLLLDRALRPGEWRRLTEEEIQILREE